MLVAEIVLISIAIYAGLGLAFAAAFVTVGVSRIDPAARGAPVGFRLLILPGSVALWPYLVFVFLSRARSEALRAE
jgi:hypothetical protein